METIRRPISKVFVASKLADLGQIVKEAIKNIGNVCVRELQVTPDGRLAQECVDEIPEIEFLFADPSVIGQVLSSNKNRVAWMQSTFAGLDAAFKVIDNLEKPPNAILTRQTDGFGQFMGEYVIGQIIARERNFTLMTELQKQSNFDCSQLVSYRGLNELCLGVIGFGIIGQEVARQCKAMNMTVWAAVRDARFNNGQAVSEHVHHIRPMSKLSEMLQACDYVVSVLPSTPESRGLLSGNVLQACEKKKSVLINIGRGDVIDDDSLVNAVRSGWLSGAILDVFNQEPLPADSPLWSVPGITITPHVSGITNVNKAVKTFTDNIVRYRNGEPMLNQVEMSKGY
ncbi:glyoxylate/hydroxypyruvate reductase A [Aplysia californica]|uniref:Glyoxylate/hydroxypyruvate reductase A n=1 Tax=Aplysia californica TaxID=6500 RepID=A0ABM0JZY9_APLCA|nr:glyoxylate/hydroxypyruvate reductase A [Aplysia californica]